MITGQEAEIVWQILGKLGVAIALIVGIIQGGKYLMSQMPVSKLEIKVNNNAANIKSNAEHLEKLDRKIEAFESKITETDTKIKHIDEGVKRIGESQISLLHHFVTGNGQDDMREEAEKLTDYFIRGGFQNGKR